MYVFSFYLLKSEDNTWMYFSFYLRKSEDNTWMVFFPIIFVWRQHMD
jgi:hypothetical protein